MSSVAIVKRALLHGDRTAIIAKGPLDSASLRSWAKERLAPYKVPVEIKIVDELPRNVLGKPVKPEVARMF